MTNSSTRHFRLWQIHPDGSKSSAVFSMRVEADRMLSFLQDAGRECWVQVVDSTNSVSRA